MPQEFQHTLHALNAERPLASWVAMAVGAVGLALWSVWLVEARLPQRLITTEVRRDGDQIVAHFAAAPAAPPETALVISPAGDHLARVIASQTNAGSLDLRIAAPANQDGSLPQVALPLPALSPLNLILASLGLQE